jgi:formate C-acetyltransferase
LETGNDLVFGSVRYRFPGVSVFGAANVYDSLSALKKHVFTDQTVSMNEMCSALKNDYRGQEKLQALLVNETPRYGNDIDEVDSICGEVDHAHADFLGRFSDPRGGVFTCGVWPVEGHVHTGKHTGATPDGRPAGAPVVDGVGACQGADRKGPTALLKSVAKLHHGDCWSAGNTCNIKFNASSVQNGKGRRRLSEILWTYMTLGGQQVQVNIVDNETLIDAQRRPEAYRHLLVRVAGFSAYFTDLTVEVQNEIISRNTHHV